MRLQLLLPLPLADCVRGLDLSDSRRIWIKQKQPNDSELLGCFPAARLVRDHR